ncbi:MAG: hypothetical protein EXS36_07170 [Pedosphaera sp.]|nr:hypothetical protein [Pedosphaera sp.]
MSTHFGIEVVRDEDDPGNGRVVLDIVTRDPSSQELGEDGSPKAAVLKLRRVEGASLAMDGKARRDILGPTNQWVTVDVSEDLKTWVELKPVLLQGDGAGSGVDLNADKSNHRFYRAQLLPVKY